MQSLAAILGKRYGLRIAENLDGLSARIHHHFAVRAFGHVRFDFGPQRRIDRFVQIIRQFRYKRFALHEVSP
jgi:hypothetical protein